MKNQAQLVSTSEILEQFYNYVFGEVPSYHFTVPKSPAFIPAVIPGKESRCLHCGKIIATAYENRGELYLDKTRLIQQQQLYSKYGLPFPDIAQGIPLVYQQEGYCTECFPVIQKKSREAAQSVYSLCSQIIRRDTRLTPALTALAKQKLPSAVITKEKMRSLLSADKSIQTMLQQYRQQRQSLTASVTNLLDKIGSPQLEAYVGKPLNILESMSGSIYNEYTAAIPAKDTPNEYFFIKATIKKSSVKDFLELPRIDSVEKYLAEPGVEEALLIAHSS